MPVTLQAGYVLISENYKFIRLVQKVIINGILQYSLFPPTGI